MWFEDGDGHREDEAWAAMSVGEIVRRCGRGLMLDCYFSWLVSFCMCILLLVAFRLGLHMSNVELDTRFMSLMVR